MKKRKQAIFWKAIPWKGIVVFTILNFLVVIWLINCINGWDGYDEEDVYHVSGSFRFVYLDDGVGRGTEIYYKLDNEMMYRLVWYAGARYAPEAVEVLNQCKEEITVSVLKKRSLHSRIFGYRETIDIRTDSTVFYDAETTNNFIRRVKPIEVIVWSLSVLLLLGAQCAFWWLKWRDIHTTYHKWKKWKIRKRKQQKK